MTVPVVPTSDRIAHQYGIGWRHDGVTPPLPSILSSQVTNAVTVPQADLAVAMTVPASAVFTNDWMVYGVSVTNLGPDTASGVFLTNTLPPGVGFKSVSPALTPLSAAAMSFSTWAR